MNIKEMIVSGLLKKGLLYEGKNVELDFELPMEAEGKEPQKVKITLKAEHMTIKLVND